MFCYRSVYEEITIIHKKERRTGTRRLLGLFRHMSATYPEVHPVSLVRARDILYQKILKARYEDSREKLPPKAINVI